MNYFKLSSMNQNGLRYIVATKDLERFDVKKGDRGGCVASEASLSDSAWVGGDAQVFGNARISGNAYVGEQARIYDNAHISDNADVTGYARVTNDARVGEQSHVYGHAVIRGRARVYGNARVCEHAEICDNARIYGNAEVSADARVYGEAHVHSTAQVRGSALVAGNANISNKKEGSLYLPPRIPTNFLEFIEYVHEKTAGGFEIVGGQKNNGFALVIPNPPPALIRSFLSPAIDEFNIRPYLGPVGWSNGRLTFPNLPGVGSLIRPTVGRYSTSNMVARLRDYHYREIHPLDSRPQYEL